MDHLDMKQAIINALKHQISLLQDDLIYTITIKDDQVLISDALAKSLQTVLSLECTTDDILHANKVLKIWEDNRADYYNIIDQGRN